MLHTTSDIGWPCQLPILKQGEEIFLEIDPVFTVKSPCRRLERGDIFYIKGEQYTPYINDPISRTVCSKNGTSHQYDDVELRPVSPDSRTTDARTQIINEQTDTYLVCANTVNDTVHCGDIISVDSKIIFIKQLLYRNNEPIRVEGHLCMQMSPTLLVEGEGYTGQLDDSATLWSAGKAWTRYWQRKAESTLSAAVEKCHVAALQSVTDHNYQLTVRKQTLRSLIKKETRAMSKTGRSKTFVTPLDILADPILFDLTTSNNFERHVYPHLFYTVDEVAGVGWDFKKISSDDFFLCVTRLSVAMKPKEQNIKFCIDFIQAPFPWSPTYRDHIMNLIKSSAL